MSEDTPPTVDDPTAPAMAAGELATTRHAEPPRVPVAIPRRTGIFVDPVELRVHVGELLRATLGGYEVDASGNFTFTYEEARIFVTVAMSPAGPQVGIFSITNVDAELTSELARFLLTTNQKLGYGAFGYDEENRAIWLRHSLFGATLDGPELQTAVAAIASTAAHFDGVIHDEYGAPRFSAASDEVQQQAHAPRPDEDPLTVTGYL